MSVHSESFEDGHLEYSVYQKAKFAELPPEVLPESKWDDGYVAFSRGEKRWKDIPEAQRSGLWGLPPLSPKEDNPVIPGVVGYVMEINLWRHKEQGIFEEISIEREDRQVFCQYWKLETGKSGVGETRCYFRQAETIASKPVGNQPIFQEDELRSLECIVPKHRLHFFITTGKKS